MNINNLLKTWSAGKVAYTNTEFICTLVIKTEQAANWYTQKVTMPIDRSDKGKIYEYETFFYQNGANSKYNAPTTDIVELATLGGVKWS